MVLNGNTYKAFSISSLNKTNKRLIVGNNKKRNASNSISGILYYLKVNDKPIDLFNAKIMRNIETYDSCKNHKCNVKAECVIQQNEIGYKCIFL